MRRSLPILVLFFLSGCASIFPENTSSKRKRSASVKFSTEQDIPKSKVRPSAYSGTLQRYNPSFWQLPFFESDYDYHITDKKGETIAFLDISDLATGTPLTNLLGKNITVNGQSFPHKYRGVVVVKAKNIVVSTDS
jgi:uncharacterized protein YceK